MIKRILPTIYIICISLLLSGCSVSAPGSIFSCSQEISELLLLQTLGLDETDGSVTLSAATGVIGDSPPRRYKGEGGSISSARADLQSYAQGSVPFYSTVKHLLLGEEAAAGSLEGYLDYITRSDVLREDSPLFVVKGGSASALVTKAGGETSGITELLSALEGDTELYGDGVSVTAAALYRSILENGGGIAQVLTAQAENLSDPDASTGELTAKKDGIAVFKGYTLAGYIPQSDARGVNILLNRPGAGSVTLDTDFGKVSVEFDKQSARYSPLWNADGSLAAVEVAVKLTAALSELERPQKLTAEKLAAINEALEAQARQWTENVLRAEKALACDFLGIGRQLEISDPAAYRAMSQPFSAQLSAVTFRLSVTAEVERSYSLSEPA